MNKQYETCRAVVRFHKMLLLLALLLPPCLPGATPLHAQTVSIYGDFQEKLLGRSEIRGPEMLRTYSLAGLAGGQFKSFGPDGQLTAVVLDRRMAMKLREAAVAGAPFENGRLWTEKKTGREIFLYYNPASGLRFSFSLEEPAQGIFRIIEQAYRRDLGTLREVAERYRRNYVIRLHAANGFLSPREAQPRFEEALAFATLIGDRDQWLYGIHDGNAFFASIASADNYRNYFKNADRMLAFMHGLELEIGDFPRNLLHAVIRETADEPADSPAVLLPEEFIETRRGSTREFAYFYFDMLKRKRYECMILCMKKSREVSASDYVTLFKRPGDRGGNWNAFWGRDLRESVDTDYRKVPARLYGAESVFVIIDPLEFLVDRRMNPPDSFPAGLWRDSRL